MEEIDIHKTKVLVLIKGLGRGGAEQLLVNAAPYLDTGRFNYEFAYLLPWKNALVEDLQSAGFPIRCLNGARGVGWIKRLRRMVAEQHIEIIHAHLPYTAIGARIAFWRNRSVRVVYTEHNMWSRYKAVTAWANALTFQRNDHVFTVSDEVRGSVRYPKMISPRRLPPMETLYQGRTRQPSPGGWPSTACVRNLESPTMHPSLGQLRTSSITRVTSTCSRPPFG